MGYLANRLGDPMNLGWFADEAALIAAYPVGADGYFAMVGSTDTFWTWDSGTGAWVDTGTAGPSRVARSSELRRLPRNTGNNLSVRDATRLKAGKWKG